MLDSSGYGKDGTVNGAVLTSDPDFEQLGNILSFDGLDDYVDFGTSAHYISTEGTIELWFYLESVTDNDNLIELYENNSNRLTVYLFDTEGMLFKIVDGGATYNVWSDSALSLARWYHVVFTYGANGMQMYINGEKQDETTSHAGAFSTTAPSFRISYQVGVPSRKLDGFADEVRIYEQAMSATEIQKHYVQGLAKHKDLAIK